MTEDTVIRIVLFAVIAILSFWGWRWFGVLGNVSDPAPPVQLTPDSPRDQHEARCIDAQNATGRELNGYVWKNEG